MVLDKILREKRESVRTRKACRPLSHYLSTVAPSDRSMTRALSASPCSLILECKRRSPSKGLLREDYDPASIARQYSGIASAISVLTDEPFFSGDLSHLQQVSQAVPLPVLCKDFIIDPYQIYEARYHGADAILLMASVLDDPHLREFMEIGRQLDLDALVEVHDDEELTRAVDAGAKLLGINNRDLRTLEIDLTTTERLAPLVPDSAVTISESGIRDHSDLRRLRDLVDGFLIGTSLMQRTRPGRAAREVTYGRVKVCGLTREEDALLAWKHGATWGGLIFAPGSPRAVTPERALALRSSCPHLLWAGVFVDEDPGRIIRLVADLHLDAIQLHGEESPDTVQELRGSCEIWKAIRVDDRIPPVESTGADRLLLDAYHPSLRGGTGQTFDWDLLEAHPQRNQIILAGGLDAENAVEADKLGPWALDVNSGVESAPGKKSEPKLRSFFNALRGNNP